MRRVTQDLLIGAVFSALSAWLVKALLLGASVTPGAQQQAKTPDKRAAKIAELVAMLSRGDTLHPRKTKRAP